MYDFLVSSLSGNILIRSFIHSLLIRKQVDFEGEGKVLLTRLGDQIHATSAFCTHYGAPLVKGVLTADGRVVWYVIPSFPPPVVLVVLSKQLVGKECFIVVLGRLGGLGLRAFLEDEG